ncbi:hypothetical protein EDD86DRAFT_111406 [Gorgonomyces haynaldii]|nr:hypothetical protein EDD86DRAFT_111406 [Gorgonomyces haynaldii]
MSDHAIRIPRVSSFGSRMGSLKSNSQGFGRSLMPTSSLASRLSSTSLQAMFAEPKLEREQSLVMVRFHIDESFERHYSTQKVAEQPESSFFTQKQDLLYQLTVKSYCDHLYSWRMYNEKAELESLCHVLREEHHGLEIRPSCPECSAPMIQNSGIYSCPRCRANRAGVKCTVCRLPVHGLSWFCEQCRHGGHVHHLKEWFQENEQCPLGCGCICN